MEQVNGGAYSERKNAAANDTSPRRRGAGVLTAFERADPILIKIEAPRSGFDFGRRSDGASVRRRLFGTKKRRRERYEVRDDVVPVFLQHLRL